MIASSQPMASVVIPSFNAEKWIGKTLDSLVQQTFTDFEVIVVDDGSSDNTLSEINKYAKLLNLNVIVGENSGGPSQPRNTGIAAARSDLIVFCDADDLAMPERLEWTIRAWDKAGYGDCLLFSDFAEIDFCGKAIHESSLHRFSGLIQAKTHWIDTDIVRLSSVEAFGAMLTGNFLRPSAVAIPRSLIKEFRGFDETMPNGSDFDLYIRIAYKYPFMWIRRALTAYRHTPGSISSRSAQDRVPSMLGTLDRVLKMPLSQEQKKLVRARISAVYEAVGYENSSERRLWLALKAYKKAFINHPRWRYLRGSIAAIIKTIM